MPETLGPTRRLFRLTETLWQSLQVQTRPLLMSQILRTMDQ